MDMVISDILSAILWLVIMRGCADRKVAHSVPRIFAIYQYIAEQRKGYSLVLATNLLSRCDYESRYAYGVRICAHTNLT